jgi:hypothetical protein
MLAPHPDQKRQSEQFGCRFFFLWWVKSLTMPATDYMKQACGQRINYELS